MQAKWTSLQAIFMGSADIKKQLPDDTKAFMEVDAQWRALMWKARSTPIFVEACNAPGRRELLEQMKQRLEMCQKALFKYLEAKRRAFPRFYFVADTVLEEILSQGHNPLAIQKHIGTCFDNIAALQFKEKDSDRKAGDIVVQLDGKAAAGSSKPRYTNIALGMHSKDGDEYVEMKEPFVCEGDVEDWLNRLVDAMRDTLREILARAKATADHWESSENPRHKWVFDYPAQLALTASQTLWTEEVGAAFDAYAEGNDQAIKSYQAVIQTRLDALTNLVDDRTLSKRDRIKIITLITVDVHNRDVVDRLIRDKVGDAGSFAWQSQLRYHWKADTKDCVIKIADASFNYSYEYVGNTGRLVITPLTDRCYITLTQVGV